MNKVYIVTSGHYSDYGIRACFSDENKAEIFMSVANDPDMNIEIWLLDANISGIQRGERLYHIHMSKNGDVDYISHSLTVWQDKVVPSFEIIPRYGGASFLYARFWAKSEEHAIKIANEKRTQLIAEGEWDAT